MGTALDNSQLFTILARSWVAERVKRAKGAEVKLTYGKWLELCRTVSVIDHESQDWFGKYRDDLDARFQFKVEDYVDDAVFNAMSDDAVNAAAVQLRGVAQVLRDGRLAARRKAVLSQDELMVIDHQSLVAHFIK